MPLIKITGEPEAEDGAEAVALTGSRLARH